MVWIALISSIVSWYSAYWLAKAVSRGFLVPIIAVVGIALGIASGVGISILLLAIRPDLFSAIDIPRGGIGYSSFSWILGPWAAYLGFKARPSISITDRDLSDQNRVGWFSRNRAYFIPRQMPRTHTVRLIGL